MPAPLSAGDSTEYKEGALGIGGIFQTDGETHLAIDGGNVGIGTTSPGAKLDVDGEIREGEGLVVEGSTQHDHAGIRSSSGHLMIDSPLDGNLYLNWDNRDDYRTRTLVYGSLDLIGGSTVRTAVFWHRNQTASAVSGVKILRINSSHWGTGVVKVEIYSDYYRHSRWFDYGMFVVGATTREGYLGTSMREKIPYAGPTPYWGSWVYPCGATRRPDHDGCYDLMIDLPSYSRLTFVVTWVGLTRTNDPDNMGVNSGVYFYPNSSQ